MEIITNFDNDSADISQNRAYYEILDKYNAYGIGHEKTKTSSIFIPTIVNHKFIEFNINDLKKDLEKEDIKILNIYK